MLPLLIGLGMAAVSMAGSGMRAAGQAQQGADQYKAAYRQANNIIIESRFKLNDIERQRIRTISTQKASFASRGVKLDGSPLELLAETNYLASVDKGRVEYQARENAAETRASGNAALTAGRMGAIGSILGGVGSAASSFVGGQQFGAGIKG